DVVSFEVPVESGRRHLVTATGVDGTRAEAYVTEHDGIARPDAVGYTMTLPSAAPVDVGPAAAGVAAVGGPGPSPTPRPNPGGPPSPIATVKNGFTKLK